MYMLIARTLPELRRMIRDLKQDGGIALVPTMGALHAGHMALVKEAKIKSKHVVVSIFVNPKQFGPNEDLDSYPRQQAEDIALLEENGVSLLWLPDVETMYPKGFATQISVSGVSEGLCGAARPGHFDGVATVVTKLLLQVLPDIALFGEKDYQQLAVIRRFAEDFNIPVQIQGVAIQRAEDGLALSSRNAYLTKEERAMAPYIYITLQEAAQAMQNGEDVAESLASAVDKLKAKGFGPVDYLELRDDKNLTPLTKYNGGARLFVAAKLGSTRLIDNIAV